MASLLYRPVLVSRSVSFPSQTWPEERGFAQAGLLKNPALALFPEAVLMNSRTSKDLREQIPAFEVWWNRRLVRGEGVNGWVRVKRSPSLPSAPPGMYKRKDKLYTADIFLPWAVYK